MSNLSTICSLHLDLTFNLPLMRPLSASRRCKFYGMDLDRRLSSRAILGPEFHSRHIGEGISNDQPVSCSVPAFGALDVASVMTISLLKRSSQLPTVLPTSQSRLFCTSLSLGVHAYAWISRKVLNGSYENTIRSLVGTVYG